MGGGQVLCSRVRSIVTLQAHLRKYHQVRAHTHALDHNTRVLVGKRACALIL